MAHQNNNERKLRNDDIYNYRRPRLQNLPLPDPTMINIQIRQFPIQKFTLHIQILAVKNQAKLIAK